MRKFDLAAREREREVCNFPPGKTFTKWDFDASAHEPVSLNQEVKHWLKWLHDESFAKKKVAANCHTCTYVDLNCKFF